MVEGPWSYRVLSIVLVSPMYAITLFVIGTLAGRHNFFAKMSFKILNRFLPNKVLDKMRCDAAINKILNK